MFWLTAPERSHQIAKINCFSIILAPSCQGASRLYVFSPKESDPVEQKKVFYCCIFSKFMTHIIHKFNKMLVLCQDILDVALQQQRLEYSSLTTFFLCSGLCTLM